jgi:trans-2,3-dihydro-3-hydroxyanthranilate isomerase
MRSYEFAQVDVFTDRVFGGNPLAVFPEATGLSGVEMQAIAQEMNLAETTFVLSPSRADCVARVRIFTPARELPFAGHPTLGTAYVLAGRGRLPAGGSAALEEGVGPVPVRLEGDPVGPSFIWMRHPAATFGPPLEERGAVAAALGLAEPDLLAGAPIMVGSTGVSFLYVPLRDRAAVDRAAADAPALRRVCADPAVVVVFLFAPEPEADPPAGRVYARMFAPEAGIVEDPATGSASGPLGAYLVRHGLVASADEVRIVSEQGTRMGRQSFLHVRVRRRGERGEEIEVGGGVVPVLEGVLHLPDAATVADPHVGE